MTLELDEETLAVLVPSWGWFHAGIEAAAAETKHLEQKRRNARMSKRRRSETGPCPNCKRDFDHRGSGRGWLRTYCSDACRKRFNDGKLKAAKRVTKSPATKCGQCGAPLVVNPKHKPRKWCSEKCRGAATRERRAA